ncbi:retinoic acid receptor responder protein 2-like isoform X1 [Phyllobates terribilis]|uniref:retinoic acid receptor responder protein 2-like isoform X1 n=1 Tax=Phyllobates terribilis TaxID=111132 RepID=UPI003CCB6667
MINHLRSRTPQSQSWAQSFPLAIVRSSLPLPLPTQSPPIACFLSYCHNPPRANTEGPEYRRRSAAWSCDYISGAFVNLEIELKQTTCHKSNWTKTDCGLMRNGRTFNCFACFKFSYHSDNILSQLMDCVAVHQVDARAKRRNQSCTEVEMKEGFDKPGSYGFLKSN